MQVEDLENEPETQASVSDEDDTVGAMNGAASHSPFPHDDDDDAVDGAALAENDLLGFSMNNDGVCSSHDGTDLLGFSTPAASSSTDDLLDFASAPTSTSTSPETSEQAVVSQQGNEMTQDLLGFMSTAHEVVANTDHPQASTTTNDLLDFSAPVPAASISTTPSFAGAESTTTQESSPRPNAFAVNSPPDDTTRKSPPSEHTANPVWPTTTTTTSDVPHVLDTSSETLESKISLPNVVSSEPPVSATSDSFTPLIGDVEDAATREVNETITQAAFEKDAETEPMPTERNTSVSQPETTLGEKLLKKDDSNEGPVETIMQKQTTEKDKSAQTADTSNDSDLLPSAAAENKSATKAKPNVDFEPKASVPPLDVPGNDERDTNVVVLPTRDAVARDKRVPEMPREMASGDVNADNTAESTNNDAVPLDGDYVLSKSLAVPSTDNNTNVKSQQERDVNSLEEFNNIDHQQKPESVEKVELNEKDIIRADNDNPRKDEDEGMADVELDEDPMKPPVVVETSEHAVLSESVAEQVRQADPWQIMDSAVETDTSDPKESFDKQVSSTAVSVSAASAQPRATIVDFPTTGEQSSDDCAEKDALLVELQSSLQDHMSKQAEAENRARNAEARMKQLEEGLRAKENVEKELESMKRRMKSVVSGKANLELELAKLRASRDEQERKEIVLSNRLNAAKKKEAVKADLAERLEAEVEELQAELSATKEKLAQAEGLAKKTEKTLQETTQLMSERVRLAETALADERRLNEDRKKKMKAFIESKQEEIRQGKLQTDELNAELEQTNRLLREQSSRWKQLHAQWVQSQTRNRELQRDLNRIKKDSDNMHKIGDKMEMKLSKSAQETEEHKTKRLTAKHELMTILRTLEGEREVSAKLRDSLKFTFTPKALSQQQLLKESLKDFDTELQKLSRRLGRPLPPSIDSPGLLSDDDDTEGAGAAMDLIGDGSAEEGRDAVLNRSEIDSNHLISNLESETQRVSQCIMALMSSIERMHVVLDESGPNTCINALTNILMGNAPPQTNDISGERTSMRSTRYGQVPQANRDY